MIDEILQKFGLAYKDLKPGSGEYETLNSWLQALQQGALTVEKIRDNIHSMRDSVESELTKPGLDSKQDLFLKARLRNYMLLEAFLSSPEKAKAQIERALAGIAPKRG